MKHTVLILDDDPFFRKLVCRMLEREGFSFRAAADAQSARELIAAEWISLILCDINLPGQSGLEFVRSLLTHHPTIAVIMVTGLADRKLAEEALSMGVYGYLIKPFEAVQLIITIDNALRRLNVEQQMKDHIKALDHLVRERTNDLHRKVEELEEIRSRTLRENEEKKQIMEAIPSILIGVSGNDAIIHWNQSAVKTFNIPTKQVVGKRFQDCPVDWDLNKLETAIFFCKKHYLQVRVDDITFTKPNGTKGELGITLSPMPAVHGRDNGFIFIAADITDLKQARKKLQMSEDRHRTLFENSHDAIFTMEPPSWKFTSCNQATLNLFGAEDENTLMDLAPWDVSPEYQPGGLSSADVMLRKINQAISRGSVFFEYTHQVIRGDTFPATVLLTRMELAGRLMVQGTVRNISEQKSLELQLSQARKLEAVGQLAAGIAHEINTPIQYVGDNHQFLEDAFSDLLHVFDAYEQLKTAVTEEKKYNALVTAVDAALDDADVDYLKEEIPQAMAQTREGVQRITAIVRSMKEFSHPGVREKTPLDINRAIESTLTVSRNEWKYTTDVTTHLAPDLPLVTCLPGELNQVFLNIIINAAQAIGEAVPEGESKKGKVEISTTFDEKWVEIRIADSGPGIPESIQSRIFDPFFTTKAVGKGTGQGLAISQSIIVEKHGGTLEFETSPEKGTTFIIKLPVESEIEP